MEIWKDIKGYVGAYQVSNLGNVRGLIFRNNNAMKPKIHLISKTDNGNGYLIVSLYNGEKRKNHYVHRLVADAFCEHPHGKDYVNHKDYDTKNNQSENLEWCTQRENIHCSRGRMMIPRTRCTTSATGEKHIGFRRGRYRVHLDSKKGFSFDKSFKTMREAREYRDECERIIYG